MGKGNFGVIKGGHFPPPGNYPGMGFPGSVVGQGMFQTGRGGKGDGSFDEDREENEDGGGKKKKKKKDRETDDMIGKKDKKKDKKEKGKKKIEEDDL